jgi:hypothetical protein
MNEIKKEVTRSEIAKQYWKELKIPFIVAALYVGALLFASQFNTKNDTLETVLKYVGLFFGSLWFVGGFTGGWERVRHKLEQKKSLDSTETRLEAVAKKLDEQTDLLNKRVNHLLGHLTGGDSFIYFELQEQFGTNYLFEIKAFLKGEYPLSDVVVTIVGDNIPLTEGYVSHITVGRLTHSLSLNFNAQGAGHFHYVIKTNSGSWIQRINYNRIEDVDNIKLISIKTFVLRGDSMVYQDEHIRAIFDM